MNKFILLRNAHTSTMAAAAALATAIGAATTAMAATTHNVATVHELTNAVAVASSGDTILLATGTYDLSEVPAKDPATISSSDKNGLSSLIVNNKKLYFVGADATSWRDRPDSATAVVLKGTSSARILYGYAGGGRSSTFSNITFDGGNAPNGKFGGAIYFYGTEKGGFASNCVFRGCTAANGGATYEVTAYDCLYEDNVATGTGSDVVGFGGGAWGSCRNSTPKTNAFVNCVFRRNRARCGGGLYCNIQGKIENCLFDSNSATENGGAVSVQTGAFGPASVLGNCIFTDNVSTNNGGAVYHAAGISSCAFTRNMALDAQSKGGAVYGAAVTGCSFTNNAAAYGGAIAGDASGTALAASASGCSFYGNTAKETGGAAYNVSSATNCSFEENAAKRGGGASRSTLANCSFNNNRINVSGGRGGACENSFATHCAFTGVGDVSCGGYDRCTFDGVVYDNSDSNCPRHVFDCLRHNGGAIGVTNCLVTGCAVLRLVNIEGNDAEFVNCTFASNRLGNSGQTIRITTGPDYKTKVDGINVQWPGTVSMVNCVFSCNEFANGNAADLVLDKGGTTPTEGYGETTITLRNCLHTSDIAGSSADVAENLIHAPARFVAGDARFPNLPFFSLRRSSDARNTGLNAAWMTTATDLAGNVRIFDGTVDLGCYECLLESEATVLTIR